jgi:hypothetical protein
MNHMNFLRIMLITSNEFRFGRRDALSAGLWLVDRGDFWLIRVFLEGATIEEAVGQIGAGDLDRFEELMALWKDNAQEGSLIQAWMRNSTVR